MASHWTFAKAAFITLMKMFEARSDYYLARNNRFHPFVNPIVGIRTRRSLEFDPNEAWVHGLDKVLIGITQLLSDEIHQRKVEGAIAELGAYQGFHASVMGHFFPDRRFYLFDTFEGLDPRDLEADEKLGYNTNAYHDFSDTNVELVLSRMRHHDNVSVRKGWFPDSAAGLEGETFCFVSIDADLFQPIHEGLHWFYQRLAKGGYILVDDFNWREYPGAKKAVHDFSTEAGVSYVPIPNTTGSVVIGKPLIP